MGPLSLLASIVCALVPLAIVVSWYRASPDPSVDGPKPDEDASLPWWRPEQP